MFMIVRVAAATKHQFVGNPRSAAKAVALYEKLLADGGEFQIIDARGDVIDIDEVKRRADEEALAGDKRLSDNPDTPR